MVLRCYRTTIFSWNSDRLEVRVLLSAPFQNKKAAELVSVAFLFCGVLERGLEGESAGPQCGLSERDASERPTRWPGGARAGRESERLAESS